MNLSYVITEKDYLVYQLFVASSIKKLKRKRIRRWLTFSSIYLIAGIILYFFTRQQDMGLVIIGLATLWLVIYPFYSRWIYKDRYKKYVRKHYSAGFDKTVSIAVEKGSIELGDGENSTKFSCENITGIYTIRLYIFMELKSGGSIIIPKLKAESSAITELLTYLVKNHQTPIIQNPNWKWK
ncbi:MAG: hypothetical protein ACI9N1_002366 [Flavobacteriales bacterium]|jgi:hypothetical protein